MIGLPDLSLQVRVIAPLASFTNKIPRSQINVFNIGSTMRWLNRDYNIPPSAFPDGPEEVIHSMNKFLTCSECELVKWNRH